MVGGEVGRAVPAREVGSAAGAAGGAEAGGLAERLDTVLVANRGEIARRVIRTLRRLGIRSVAVYSDADAEAPHVREADVAVRIGPAPAAASYLSVEAVLAAAAATGARAVHPGYGFLSESAAFARACSAAGIVFVGPGERALEVMGDKIRAKEQVAAHGVPIVPGLRATREDGTAMTDAAIARRADETGYPLLIKPSAGGGGKGMQVVRAPADLPEALAAARRIATAAFGDDRLLLERLIERPRHIEVQVLADAHGAVIHLGERECTLQRRHQKVVEEAPSPVVDAVTRARLGAAACAAAASVDYSGAGTVEFLVSADRPDEFFFIEMNTRLQVEHPVTELVTGIDLVEQQLRVAAGLPLGLAQADVALDGHAIEARVYAESPSRGFLPAAGDVLLWRPAAATAAPRDAGADAAVWSGVRTDAAVETGSVVTADYDPLVAKVIAHGADRAEALARLDAALADTVLLGLDTNIAFLRALLADPAVQAGEIDTGLIDRMPPFADPAPGPAALDAAASVAFGGAASEHVMCSGRAHTSCTSTSGVVGADTRSARVEPTGLGEGARSGRAGAVWRSLPGWRLGGTRAPASVLLLDDTGTLHAVAGAGGGGSCGRFGAPDAATSDTLVSVGVAGAGGGDVWVHAGGATHRLRPLTRRQAMQRRLAARERDAAATDPELRAPMPGAVVAVHVADGATVTAGDRVVTIEAMKMEHPVLAPHDGRVRLDVATGDQVGRDQVLAHVSVPETSAPPLAPGADAHEAPATPSAHPEEHHGHV